MRPRLRNDTYEHGQQYHPRDALADKCLDVKVMQPDLDDNQCTEGPEENRQEMLADDVFPQMLLDNMLARRGDKPHHNKADEGKDEVHPILIEDVEVSMNDFHDFLVLVFQHPESQGHDE